MSIIEIMYKTSAQEAFYKFSRTRLMSELIRGKLRSMDVIRAGVGKARKGPAQDALARYTGKGVHPSKARLLERRTSNVPVHTQLGSVAPGTLRPASQSAMVYRTPAAPVSNSQALGATVMPGRRAYANTIYAPA